jgi:CRISPR-associated endonuclease/helicase Cas3
VSENAFANWFERVTGYPPYPYQERLATKDELPLLLDIPTGAGKTAAIVLAWLWRREKADRAVSQQTSVAGSDTEPRRLVYCLPMRSLVEQTYREIQTWLEKADLQNQVELHRLMGGAVSQRWDIHADKSCILVGTQDQLLSRALNRGYAMSRYKWPVHFALLNNDCLWVVDETQLMGTGLRTTMQLQGFREQFQTYGPTHTLWMSATLELVRNGGEASNQMQTVDYQRVSQLVRNGVEATDKIERLNEQDLANEKLQKLNSARKPLQCAQTSLSGTGKKDTSNYAKELAAEAIAAHQENTLTIVICNRVDRAQEVYRQIEKQGKTPTLIHSRFREKERSQLTEWLQGDPKGILVATQAIEAGVDISATTLFSELAPWSSLVQRFGRCNRRGEDSHARVYWIDIDLSKKGVELPYTEKELTLARDRLLNLEDVGIQSVQGIEVPSSPPEGLVPRKRDLLELFDTSADLAGHDIDVSPFIRHSEDTDVAIAWRSWSDTNELQAMGALQRAELCRVSIWKAKEFLTDPLKASQVWTWNGYQQQWTVVRDIYPGMSLLVPCSVGGYSSNLGFTADKKDKPEQVATEKIENDADSRDKLSYLRQYVSLKQHSEDVADQARQLCEAFAGFGLPAEYIQRSAYWHDFGKAHFTFQEMLTRDRPEKQETLWAKSDRQSQIDAQRKGFRHELASALIALQQQEDFLLAYLVAAHHGKVRMTIQPQPYEPYPQEGVKRYARGVWENDNIPAIDFAGIPKQTLSLDCMELGNNSWTSRAIALLQEYGPFRLAFLEALVRIADWRGSAKRDEQILGETDA